MLIEPAEIETWPIWNFHEHHFKNNSYEIT